MGAQSFRRRERGMGGRLSVVELHRRRLKDHSKGSVAVKVSLKK